MFYKNQDCLKFQISKKTFLKNPKEQVWIISLPITLIPSVLWMHTVLEVEKLEPMEAALEWGSGIANHRKAIANQATRKTLHPPNRRVTPATAPTIERAWGQAIRHHHAQSK